MMESLRSATRNTGFERWLDATLRPPPEADAPGLPGDSPKVLPPSAFSYLLLSYDGLLSSMAFGNRGTPNPLVFYQGSAAHQLPTYSCVCWLTGRRQQPAGQPPWQRSGAC